MASDSIRTKKEVAIFASVLIFKIRYSGELEFQFNTIAICFPFVTLSSLTDFRFYQADYY